MSSPHAQERVAKTQALLSKWRGGGAEVWKHERSHQGLVLRLSNGGITGCLLLYFGDVETYCGPLRWQTSKIALSADADPQTGDDIYVASDEGARFQLRCAVVEAREMEEEYPD